MREQGFLDQTGYSSQCDEMSLLYLSVEDKYDSLVANSSQVTVDECDEPQSPTTFFDRVGIKATAKPGFRKRNIHPPVLPPIMDDKRETKLQFSQCPSDCFSEDSASSVGTKTLDSFKNVTPATAEAAQYLLRLRG